MPNFFPINKQCRYNYEAQQPTVVFSFYHTDFVPSDRSLIRNSMTLSFPISREELNTLIHLQIQFQVLLIIQTMHKPKQIKMEIVKKY